MPGGGNRCEDYEEGVSAGAVAARGDHCASWGGLGGDLPPPKPCSTQGFHSQSLSRGRARREGGEWTEIE